MPSERDNASENPYEPPRFSTEPLPKRSVKNVATVMGVLSVALACVPVPSLFTANGQSTFETALEAGWFVVFTVNGCMMLREAWKARADQR
jgi:hypothetical protein